MGDRLTQHHHGGDWPGESPLLLRLTPAARARLLQGPEVAFRVDEAWSFVAGCPTEGEVDVLWIDMTSIEEARAWFTRPEAHADGGIELLVPPFDAPGAGT